MTNFRIVCHVKRRHEDRQAIRRSEHQGVNAEKFVWSITQVRNLKTLYQRESIQDLVAAFPQHAWASIQAKAREL
jgi:hypothetical protein